MYIIGKDTPTDKARRRSDALSLKEQRDYYLRCKSWLLFYNACYQLGELTKKELIALRHKVLFGNKSYGRN